MFFNPLDFSNSFRTELYYSNKFAQQNLIGTVYCHRATLGNEIALMKWLPLK